MAISPLLRIDAAPSAPPSVRRAVLRDIPDLMEFKRQMSAEDGTAGEFNASYDDWARDGFGASPRFHVLVAEHNGEVCGMLSFNEQVFAGWASPVIYVQDLFVRPQQRRRGIGRALLEQIAAEAQRRKAHFVYLNVQAVNPARKLYHGLGFARSQQCLVYVLHGPALGKLADAADRCKTPHHRGFQSINTKIASTPAKAGQPR